jgi:hypothetical protein
VELVEEGFDIGRVSDPLWFGTPGADDYEPLTAAQHAKILASEYRL